MRYILILTALVSVLSFTGASAQTTEDSVRAAVNQLFTAMREGNAPLLIASFTDSAILQTIATDKSGKVKVANESIREFADIIGKAGKGDADERIRFDLIRIDGPLAIVWTPYSFYYKGKFSHCGVDSYQLVRLDGVWKIQYIIDTRRKTPCE